ncbi:TIGR01244 family phosphatase [Rhizobium sp. ARZ01]|uniref:TIGR01244 family sulfur transferase n=1 Tax=Rhizobium sp. ARZ01 TaxID=2769313 RepID=UPI001783936E|nr:TIGR01244 family sulfur transferase [Rhizobium sp. ARZ01]MBD9373645.1 TIGR01244 family phosphatase [Rhizobium sp. ARZ01]
MEPIRINERLWVCGQIRPKDVEALAAAGFTALINNRPDCEDFCQPRARAIAEAAAQAALSCEHIPVRSQDIAETTIRAFQRAIAASSGPVLAFCRSGTRSLTLWAIGEVLNGRLSKAEATAFGGKLGLDLSGAVAWLNARGY